MTAALDRRAGSTAGATARPGGRWRALADSPVWPRAALAVGLAAIVLSYVPILWLALMSFSERPFSGLPWPLTLDWYREMAADRRWPGPMGLSLALAGAVAVICMVAATAVGRGIMRLRRPGGVLALAVVPLFVPGLTIGAALFLFFRSYLDLRLGVWSMLIGHVVWALPFALLLVVVMLSRFDRRLVEAAADLGASPRRIFLDIELPILRPAVVGAGLFGFLLSFTELMRSIFLRGTATSMPVFQWAQSSDHQSYVPISFALSTIILAVTLPVLGAFFWILFRGMEGPRR